MKKSPAPAPRNDPSISDALVTEDLIFPVSDFVSQPPNIDPQAMLRRIEETMPWRSQQPGAKEQRLAEKIDVEFVL